MNIFTLTTSYTFEFTLIAMLAASAYFILERYKLSNEYKSISTLAFLTTFLAVIEYYNMREFFSLSNLNNPNINYPTEYMLHYLVYCYTNNVIYIFCNF